MVNKRLRLGLVVLLAVALGGAAWWTLSPREPRYEGKPLSFWLDELTHDEYLTPATNGDDSGSSERKAKAADAIRSLGTNALPALVARLTNHPAPSRFRIQLEALLAKQSLVEITLPEPLPDKSWQSIRAFQVLGPVAEPAIPALAEVLANERWASAASLSLAVVGPAAVPVLVGALTNANDNVRRAALMALGDIGPSASAAVPVVEEMIRSPSHPSSDEAMRVLSRIAEPTDQRIAWYSRHLDDSNHVHAAAFALGLSGAEALPSLLQTLTNEDQRVRTAGFAALQLEMPNNELGKSTRPSGHPHHFLVSLYNMHAVILAARLHRGNASAALAATLAAHLDTTNAVARTMIVDLLARQGLDGVAGLSKAQTHELPETRSQATQGLQELGVEVREGGIIRGPKSQRRLALVFTAHEFAEGGETILDELKKHEAKGSFFLTGDFLANPEFKPLIERLVHEEHYIGPHSDKHLLYCSWERPPKLLVTRDQFASDLAENLRKIGRLYDKPVSPDEYRQLFAAGQPLPHGQRPGVKYFMPPYEHYNLQIAEWTTEMNMRLVNFTPGTRSNADYTGEADKNFVSSQAIFDSILKKEREDPHGLNGFILFLHLGAGPGRQDKFHPRFGELLDTLAAKGYQFVRIDQLLEPKLAP